VIVDLHKLNKIHEVSEKYAYALVEPGVSFFELYDYIKERNLNLWISTPALGWGSVVGNTLDRGWGYTPMGDNCAFMCGLEVVMADGTILRTGMGQLEGGKTWNLFKNGYGPGFDGLFNQSNFGIVVKMVSFPSHLPSDKRESGCILLQKVLCPVVLMSLKKATLNLCSIG